MATTAFDVVGGDRSVVVARINGELRDLSTPVTADDVVEPVGVDTPEGLAVLRHSAAHVLAQAVQQAYPEAKLGVGPPVKDGFYYDFDVATPFTPDDLADLRADAPGVVARRVPRYEEVYARRGWRMPPGIDRVYVNEKARRELGWEPQYDFQWVIESLRAGEDPRSPLARVIGSKGYHDRAFAGGPYPVS